MPVLGRLVLSSRFPVFCLFAALLGSCADPNKPAAPTTPGAAPATPAAAGAGGTKRLIFLTNGEDPYWDTCNAGFQEGGKEFLKDSKLVVEFHKNSGNADGQINRLRQYLSESDIAGLAISVYNADNAGIAAELKNLQAAGVQVITVDGDLNTQQFPGHRPYYIGTDNLAAGKVLGTAAKHILAHKKNEKGAYVQFAGDVANDNARKRMDGFQEAVGGSYKELDRMPDKMDQSKARDNVRVAIDNFEKDGLNLLVGIWAYDAPAIAGVVKERNSRDKYSVCVFDAHPGAIAEMKVGMVDVAVVQNPYEMGRLSVKLLKAMVEKDEATLKSMYPQPAGEPGADIYTTGLRVIVPSAADSPLKPDMFDAKTVEFMELPAFTAWLDKYKLIGS